MHTHTHTKHTTIVCWFVRISFDRKYYIMNKNNGSSKKIMCHFICDLFRRVNTFAYNENYHENISNESVLRRQPHSSAELKSILETLQLFVWINSFRISICWFADLFFLFLRALLPHSPFVTSSSFRFFLISQVPSFVCNILLAPES